MIQYPIKNGLWYSLTHSDSTPGIWLIRNSDPYAYAEFVIRRFSSTDNKVPAEKVLCVEGHTANGFVQSFITNHQTGDYCRRIMNGTEIPNTNANRSFTL